MKPTDLSYLLSEEDQDLSQIEELESLKMYLNNLGYEAGSSVVHAVIDILGCTTTEQLEALEDKDFATCELTVLEYRLFVNNLRGSRRSAQSGGLDLNEDSSPAKSPDSSYLLSEEDQNLSQIEELESLKMYLNNLGYEAGSSVVHAVLDTLGCTTTEELETLEDKDFATCELTFTDYVQFVKKLLGSRQLMNGSENRNMEAYKSNSPVERVNSVDLSNLLSEEDLNLSQIEELESLKMFLKDLGFGGGSSIGHVVIDILGCASIKQLDEALEDEDFAMSGLTVHEYRLLAKKVRGTRPGGQSSRCNDNCKNFGEKRQKGVKRKRSAISDTEDQEEGLKRRRLAPSEERIGHDYQADFSEALTTSGQEWIYVIECEHDCVYVGRTHKNPQERFEEHRNGQGALWTRLHKPLKFLVDPRPARAKKHVGLEEDFETKIWMKHKGVRYVRGGSYVQAQLSEEQNRSLERELFHNAEACLRCGHMGHYSSACSAARHINGYPLSPRRRKSAGLTAVEIDGATSPRGVESETNEEKRRLGSASKSHSPGNSNSCVDCGIDISKQNRAHRFCLSCYRGRANSAVQVNLSKSGVLDQRRTVP